MNIPDIVASYKRIYPSLIDIMADDFAAFLAGLPMQSSKSVLLFSEIYNPLSKPETNRENIKQALEALEAA